MKKLLLIATILVIGLQTTLGQTEKNGQESSIHETKIQKVKVFPNPATNVINVLGLQNSNRAAIVISDLYGNIVLEHQWEIKNKALNIPVLNLEAGIYMISIRSSKQNVKIKFYKK